MPEVVGGVRIATESDFPRSPFSEHVLVGGNAYMLDLFRTFVDDLGLTASAEQFEVTRQRTVEQLRNQTVELEFVDLHLLGWTTHGRLAYQKPDRPQVSERISLAPGVDPLRY